MNENELTEKWISEQNIFKSWADFIHSEVLKQLTNLGKDPEYFLKIPPKPRLKNVDSLIDKAFYRQKNYDDPYNDIEDKVGIRFVVMLPSDVEQIKNIIVNSGEWSYDACKSFEFERLEKPLYFAYQSDHYILKPKNDVSFNGLSIPTDIPCEVQVRTLLQHAYAELTHDAIYKSQIKVDSSIQRTVAKSMALIETTDDYFEKAIKELKADNLIKYQIIDKLDNLYKSFTGNTPRNQKSSLIIWDHFRERATEDLIESIQTTIIDDDTYQSLSDTIQNNQDRNLIYKQSIILFLYWMMITHKRSLTSKWPLSKETRDSVAFDLGITL